MVKTVENYLIQQPLGQGNFAKVFKAKNIKTGQDFAIKVIPSQKFKDIPKLEQCTVNEINILSQIRNQSEYIVNYIDMLKTSNNFYFVYEYCNGGTLDRLIQKDGYFPQHKAVKFLKQILEGFKVLNKHNIMHRDLKPENILIHNGNVKIADFSFCKLLENKNDLTQTMLGSPIYMAPEVLKGDVYTIKADIWSMGIVFYKMLFGKCPYQSKSIALLIKLFERQQLEFPNEPRISPTSQQFLRRVLTKDANQRIGWDQIFSTYHITQQYEIINKKDLVAQQQQTELRMSARINSIGGTGNGMGGMRISFPANVGSGGLQAFQQQQQQQQQQSMTFNSPMGLVSPRAGQMAQMYPNPGNTTVANRTFESNYDQLGTPTVDKNLIGKKSPYKFQEQRNTVDFRASTHYNTSSNPSIQSSSSTLASNFRANSSNQPSGYHQSQQNLSTTSHQTSRISHQSSLNLNPSSNSSPPSIEPQPNLNTRLSLTRAQILTKNHLKCIQLNQMVLEIFALDQQYANYVCYFLFKNVCKEIQVLHQNLRKESICDVSYREFRGLVENQLAGLNRIIGSFYQAIQEEDRELRVLPPISNRNIDDLLQQNKQKILKLYIENLGQSQENIRLASQVVDYLVQNILIKRDAYERMSCEHLFKQMKNKVFKD